MNAELMRDLAGGFFTVKAGLRIGTLTAQKRSGGVGLLYRLCQCAFEAA